MLYKVFIKLIIYISFLTAIITTGHAQKLELLIQNVNKKPIENASIIMDNQLIGFSNEYGNFEMILTKELPIDIKVTAPGYEEYFSQLATNSLDIPFEIILLEMGDQLNEMVITAGRKAENISTIPSSVTILSRKEIEAQSTINTSLSSILGNSIPGLGTATNKANNSGQTLRGRPVLVLIDGIPQSTPLMNGARDIRTIDPTVIERIEVIKGATSIYGNGSGGGIINYITKKNTEQKRISGHTVMGTSINPFHSKKTMGYRFSHYFSGRLKKFSYTIGGTVDYTGLQRDGEGIALGQTDGLSNSYQSNFFAKMSYDIDDTSTLSGFYNLFSSTQHAKYISKNGVYGESPTIGIPGEDPGKPTGTPFNHNAMLTYSKNDFLGNSQLDATLYFNSFRSMNRYVANGSAWYGPGQTKINSIKKGIRININTPFYIAAIPFEVTYGLDLLNDVTNQDLTDGRVYIPNMDMFNLAPYAQLKVDLFENLIFKGGVRYENATVCINDFNTIATGPDNAGSIFVTGGKIPYNATMFNTGLRYNKYAIFNPFISFSQGFAINELGRILRRANESTLDKLATDPIITNNYEIGFSSKYKMLNFSASYYISTSDLGVNLVDVGGFLMPQREPENVKGYELAFDIKLSPIWTVGGSYAYVEGKATLDDGSKIYLNGSRIAPPKATGFINFTPNTKLNIQLFWVSTGSRNRFDLNSNGKYNNSEGPIKGVDLFHLSAGYVFNSQWSIGFGIENLFNKTYYPTVSQYRALDAEYVRGNGTQANLNVHYKF